MTGPTQDDAKQEETRALQVHAYIWTANLKPLAISILIPILKICVRLTFKLNK